MSLLYEPLPTRLVLIAGKLFFAGFVATLLMMTVTAFGLLPNGIYRFDWLGILLMGSLFGWKQCYDEIRRRRRIATQSEETRG